MPEKNVSARMVVRKVGIMSYAKVSTLLMAIIGLILGIFYLIVYFGMGQANAVAMDPMMQAGPWVVLIMPVVYAILGFLFGLVGAWLYNLTAKWVGGIEVEFEK